MASITGVHTSKKEEMKLERNETEKVDFGILLENIEIISIFIK